MQATPSVEKISVSSLVLQTCLSYHSTVSTSEQDIKNDIKMLPTQTLSSETF